MKWLLRITFFLSLIYFARNECRAEDTNLFRPYFKFYSGDIEPRWGIKDHWSLGLGTELNRYVGMEFDFDYYVKDWGGSEVVGQASSYHFQPALRLRYPMLNDRLVPYLLVGAGPSWIQSKDINPDAPPSNAQGWTYAASIGGGLEYFLQDDIAFGIEGRYNFVHSIDGSVGNRTVSVDQSAALFTFGLRIYFDEKHRTFCSEEMDRGPRLYFGVRAGSDFLTDGNLGAGVKLSPEQAAWGGVAGQTGGVLVGADWGQHYGAEIAGDSVNHIVNVNGLGQICEYGEGWVMANFRLRFPHGRWTPYAYVGPGICYAETKEEKPALDGLTVSGNTTNPAFNVGGGLEYFVTKRFSVNVDARWAYSWNHSIAVSNGVSAKGDISYVATTIGFKVYLFDL